MKIIYGQNLTADQTKIVGDISISCDILFDTARLLFYRGIDSVEKAKRFLSAGKKWFYNPLLLSGMKDAIERIFTAREHAENILVFGDYDADGVSATSILYFCLKEYGIKSLRIYVPERDEGYGLNLETIKRLNEQERIDLLITVDCGISDFDKIEKLKELNIDTIVTDHHEPPEILPDCIKINPKLTGQDYPFNGLCGAGVAYKLGYALIGDHADKYLDFAALATVADSMDLVDENRDIVREGLKLFNNLNSLRLPFKYLINDNNKAITAQTLAYSVAPRINAGGRMGDANCALKLFTSTNEDEIFQLAVKLNKYNLERQVECENIYQQAKAKIKKYSLNKRDVILVKDKKWNTGFIGIVAAKLVEDFARPVIVFAGQENYLKGSARSVGKINIYDAITSVKDLLIGFGGHSQAAGLSVSEENFLILDKALNEFVKNEYGKLEFEQKIYADWEIINMVSTRFAREIDCLEPFGIGNKRPQFTLQTEMVDSLPLKSGSIHYSIKTDILEILDFNGAKNVLPLSLPVNKKILLELNYSNYKGRESVKGYLRAIYPDYGDFSNLKTFILENEFKKIVQNTKELNVKSNYDLNGTGTFFVLSNPVNIKLYPELNHLPLSIFAPETKSGIDCIVISPKEIPDGYDQVIYLDKPIQAIDTDVESFVVSNITGYDILNEISTDRDDFTRIFNRLTTLNNKSFSGSADFAYKFAGEENQSTFVFAIEVFLELGIFAIKNGIFTFDEKVKNALTNSKLYSKINLLKG